MPQAYWLLKSEPETYSFAQLVRDGRTNWDGVRNYQARNFLRVVQKGDLALIYHSGDEKRVVGIAECVRTAYPDVDPDGGDWVQIDLRPRAPLAHPVSLARMKADPSLRSLLLIRQSRLSCMPVTAEEFARIRALGEETPSPPAKKPVAPRTTKKPRTRNK